MTNLKRHMQHKRLQGLCTNIVNDAVNNTLKLKERNALVLVTNRLYNTFCRFLTIINIR